MSLTLGRTHGGTSKKPQSLRGTSGGIVSLTPGTSLPEVKDIRGYMQGAAGRVAAGAACGAADGAGPGYSAHDAGAAAAAAPRQCRPRAALGRP